MSKNEFSTYSKNSIDSKLAGLKIGALYDVSISSPISTNFLRYNVETSKWENANISGLEVSNFASSSISTTIPSTGAVDTKLATEKAVRTELDKKQDSLPTTETSGKVLQSTDTAGTVEWGEMPTISVSATGTSTTVIRFITINGVEYRIGAADNWEYDPEEEEITFFAEASYTEDTKTVDFGLNADAIYDESSGTLTVS